MSEEETKEVQRDITPFAWINPTVKRALQQDPTILVGIRQGDISPCDAQLHLPRITLANVRQSKRCRRWAECEEPGNRVLCVQKFGVKMAREVLRGSTLAYELHHFFSADGIQGYNWITADYKIIEGLQEAAPHVLSFAFRVLGVPVEEVESMPPPENKYDTSRRATLVLADVLAAVDDLSSSPAVGQRVEFWPPPSKDPDVQRVLTPMYGRVTEVVPPESDAEVDPDDPFGKMDTLVIETDGGETHRRLALDVMIVEV